MYDLSIIVPTCNRAALLGRSILALTEGMRCSHEIIVVDGASTDATSAVLDQAKAQLGERLQVIRETRREGFVKATNKGFRQAMGRNMTWINDDARPQPGAFDEAVKQIDSAASDVAFLAMFHRWNSTKNIAYETTVVGRMYRLCHIRGTLYANFAIGRRQTFERLGYFDERYYFYGADPDLSLKAWHAGMRIEPAYSVIVDHDEHDDDRRDSDSARGQEDNARLFAKWDLPPKNTFHNDFDPAHPCTLRGLRTMPLAAAA